MDRFSIQTQEIIAYCKPHLSLMWAAKIVSILLECDFRDVHSAIEFYEQELKELYG